MVYGIIVGYQYVHGKLGVTVLLYNKEPCIDLTTFVIDTVIIPKVVSSYHTITRVCKGIDHLASIYLMDHGALSPISE